MKKIIAGVVLALGLVGAANANTYYVCNMPLHAIVTWLLRKTMVIQENYSLNSLT
ncbi:hypothetical protein L3I78_003016 [Escherichia coli]|nr:hypothetical protein [Escherichia coli]HBE4734691.1 hypothetical protein [Escherichia coli]HBE4974774.1 hypothetical protein [Escherichia coli]HBE5245555.1 hypothetical protein [Escherichia coli]HCP1782740.1 hypothetical protein [Escherichia coli]